MKKVVPAAKAAPESAAELPRFMNLSQVVKMFGSDEDGDPLVPESSIRYWVNVGKLSVYRPGKILLFDREEVLAFVRNSKRVGVNTGAS